MRDILPQLAILRDQPVIVLVDTNKGLDSYKPVGFRAAMHSHGRTIGRTKNTNAHLCMALACRPSTMALACVPRIDTWVDVRCTLGISGYSWSHRQGRKSRNFNFALHKYRPGRLAV